MTLPKFPRDFNFAFCFVFLLFFCQDPTHFPMSHIVKDLSAVAFLSLALILGHTVEAACSSSRNGTTEYWNYDESTYRRDPTQYFRSDTDGDGPAPYSNNEDCTWYFECEDSRYPYVYILSVNLETASSDDNLIIRPDGSITSGRSYLGSVRGATYAPRVGRTQVRFRTDGSGTAAGFTIQWCCQNEAGSCNIPDNGATATVLIIVVIVVIVIPIAILIGLVILCYQCCCKSDPPKQQQFIVMQPVQGGQAYPQQGQPYPQGYPQVDAQAPPNGQQAWAPETVHQGQGYPQSQQA